MGATESQRKRWPARTGWSWFLRIVALLGPIALSSAFVWLVTRFVELPGAPLWLLVVWWISLSVVATGILLGLDAVFRRLLPLAALLKLSLIFPDEAPSRFRLAMRTLTPGQLEEEVARAKEGHAAAASVHSAEQLLRFVSALNDHDGLTRGHSERVRAYSQIIAKQLGLSPPDVDRLNWAALLHDVGKLTVPTEILNKDGRPTEEEWESLRRHPEEGLRLAAPLSGWLDKWFQAIGDHHEKWDGSGYPSGLHGEGISLAGRIVAVADVFDVITSARSYKAGQSAAEARQELAACAGSDFDPAVVRAFLNVSLGRMRLALGPLSWLTHLPLVGSAPIAPALSGALAVAAVSTSAVVGTLQNLPPPKEPSLAVAIQPAPSQQPAPPVAPDEKTGPEAPPPATPADPAPPAASPQPPAPAPPAPAPAAAPASEPAPAQAPEPPPPEPPPPEPGAAPDAVVSMAEDMTLRFSLDLPDEEEIVALRIVRLPKYGTISVMADRRLEYTPDADFKGLVTADYETCWIDAHCDEASVTITVTPVNDAPVAADDVGAIDEGSVALVDVLGNDFDVDLDELTVEVAGSPIGAAVVSGRKIRYEPPVDFASLDVIEYAVVDGSGARATARAAITVNPVNDVPAFVAGADVVVDEDEGAQSVAGWASSISPGPANESGQTVTFTVTNDNAALFASEPALAGDGTLAYTTAPGANGIATLTITATDDGGTANGGVDTSPPVLVTLTVNP